MSYSEETIEAAKKLYLRRYRVPEIVKELGVPRRTVYFWINKYSWDDMLEHEGPLAAAGRRLETLMGMKDVSESHLNAIDRAIGAYERLRKLEISCPKQLLARATAEVKIQQIKNSTDQADDDDDQPQRRKQKGRKRNNDFRGFSKDEIEARFLNGLFQYQIDVWNERENRVRNYLKSRQIGFTYYFSREALGDALMTGRNKVFLSASRAQADYFRDYMAAFAMQAFNVELKGKDKIKVLSDHGEATLYLMSTNVATAQGASGDSYNDEYFWIPKFEKLKKVTGAVATHKHWRKTYFSTPSAKSHDAYPFWSGDIYNQERRKQNLPDVKFPEFEALRKGVLCPDGQWRKIVTIHDAMAGGCDLFDIEQLKRENTDEEFKQLYECKFIDDSSSVFQLAQLEKCLADRADWRDFDPMADRPFGNKEVWIGYDPSRTVDGASIVVLAPPIKAGGKFRVLEKITMINQAWQYQASVIKELTEKYNVKYIGIDITGPGSGVFETVQNFFPAATPIHYSPNSKTRLVLKGQDVIGNNRIEWDASWSDIAAGFMAIRRTTTGNGLLTYVADRTERHGHADAAWSILHALINEGLDHTQQRTSTYDFGD